MATIEKGKTELPRRYAVLSMDIEDWYHLDYFPSSFRDRSYSMLDGLDVYLQKLDDLSVPSSFFCVGEIAKQVASRLQEIANRGWDVGSHTYTHRRPLTLSLDEFKEELTRSKATIEDITQKPVEGFRAPCFSLDAPRLNAVRQAGFLYDSSRIDFSAHPLYGTLDMDDFKELADCTYHQNEFFEFEAPSTSVFGRKLPISGGGYLRFFPWLLMRRLISRYCDRHAFYMLYIHPFELSRHPPPELPSSVSWKTRKRFRLGLGKVERKLEALVRLLKSKGYKFTTFSDLRHEYLKDTADV